MVRNVGGNSRARRDKKERLQEGIEKGRNENGNVIERKTEAVEGKHGRLEKYGEGRNGKERKRKGMG